MARATSTLVSRAASSSPPRMLFGRNSSRSPEEVANYAKQMIGYKLYTKQTGAKGILCEKVLVCGAVDIKKEFYFAILLDRGVGGPVMIARYELVARIISSPNGGMDIEEVSKTKPESIFKLPIDVNTGLDKATLTAFAKNLGVEGKLLEECVKNMESLYDLFTHSDATMVFPLLPSLSVGGNQPSVCSRGFYSSGAHLLY